MKDLIFYKDYSNRWYVDLPEWEGSKDDLEMVAGADTMLEYISEGNNKVSLTISEHFFENADELKFLRFATELNNGSFYKMEKYKGIEINLEMWLCDVTKFVFGYFPKKIFISLNSI